MVATVTVRTADLGDLDGAYDQNTRTIWLHEDLSPAGRRCTLTHELIHAAREDVRCEDHVLNARQERLVDEMAAILLIELDDLADAMAWCSGKAEMCSVLNVDRDTLDTRLRYLAFDDHRYIEARIALIEHAA